MGIYLLFFLILALVNGQNVKGTKLANNAVILLYAGIVIRKLNLALLQIIRKIEKLVKTCVKRNADLKFLKQRIAMKFSLRCKSLTLKYIFIFHLIAKPSM